MDRFITIVLSILAIVFVVGVFILLVKYVFRPSFIYTGISLEDRITQLDKLGCKYIYHRSISKSEDIEKSPFEYKFLSPFFDKVENYQFVEAFDINSDKARFFWMSACRSLFFFPFSETNLSVTEEFDDTVIEYFKTPNLTSEVIITSSCPACGILIKSEDAVCSDCGLSLLN